MGTRRRKTDPKPEYCAQKPVKPVGHVKACRARKERYFYDPVANECQFFNYGGCAEGKNNFHTVKECMDACGGEVVDESDSSSMNTASSLFGDSSFENFDKEFENFGKDFGKDFDDD